MKKILLLAIFMFGLVGLSFAGTDYTVTLSTHNPTSGATDFTNGSYPNISGQVQIDKIIFTNAGATAQAITIYDTCTSSSAATAAFQIDLPAAIGHVEVDYPYHNLLTLTSPGIRKSDAGSAVNVNIQYR